MSRGVVYFTSGDASIFLLALLCFAAYGIGHVVLRIGQGAKSNPTTGEQVFSYGIGIAIVIWFIFTQLSGIDDYGRPL